jgi:hypothetical protein
VDSAITPSGVLPGEPHPGFSRASRRTRALTFRRVADAAGARVSGDLGRDRGRAQRPGEEPPGRGQVTPLGQQHVNDLAVLVDRPLQVGPQASHLDVSLIGKPPVTRDVTAGPGGLDELGSEPLHLPVDRDVIGGDAALGEQLLHVPVGQAVPQEPGTATAITSRGIRKPANTEDRQDEVTTSVSRPPTIGQRNTAFLLSRSRSSRQPVFSPSGAGRKQCAAARSAPRGRR